MTDKEFANLVAKKIKEKLTVVAQRSKGILPYTTINGKFDDWTEKDLCWWTNGFWGGMMWQLYKATNLELFKEIAVENEEKLDRNFIIYRGLDHDNGFKWLPTAVADYRMTGNEQSKNRGLLAANLLSGRFNPTGNYIRAWNDNGDGANSGWAIIDCMMNLPLLYWASAEINDPRFKHIAEAHANTAMKYFVREDGSVNHIVEFNSQTGEFVKTYGGQGYAEGSTWTRGQAWAVYGFTLSYMHTKDINYLNTAIKTADYFIKHIPENFLIPIDFNQPTDCTWEDSTATAIVSCGLLELKKYVSADLQKKYHDAAMLLITTLFEKRCNWDDSCDNILEKCSSAYHVDEHEFSIIYGDYYFIEAIWKITGDELFIW